MVDVALELEEFQVDFTEQVIKLGKITRVDLPPQETRNLEVEDLIDTYLEITGKLPTKRDRERLADYILAEDLKDTYRHKTATTEYPMQSAYSKRKTPQRELSVSGEIIDYLHSKYHKRLDSLYKVTTVNKGDD